ncbi:putative WRKY transcription factor [Arachis hypogaea]|nr:putative WRKY transcription factor [Arachis hypogaea]
MVINGAILSIIPSDPEVVVSNNNITNNRAGGPKHSVESIVGGNGNLRGDELDDEEDNIITRLKLRASTMASVADTMRMNNKRNKNNLSKITYMTESESESLEDGYKWRKYGKKSLKKSPFPRSYYRCTAIGCNAKKRVDRYMDDPTHVLITYVGLHAHDLPPILPPPSRSFNLYNNSTVSPKLGKGSGVQKPILSDASAGARERMYANNTITSVNVRTGNDSCVNDVGPIEDIGTGLLEDINLSSIAPHYQHHQPTFYS